MNLVINSFTIILAPDSTRSSVGLGLIGEWDIIVPKLLPLLKIMNMCSLLNHNYFNPLRPRQNGCHFAEDTFKRIFLNENVWNLIEIPLKFVPKGPINNIPALVKIMAWRRPGYKPLSEPMMVRLPMHIRVFQPQWVKWLMESYKTSHIEAGTKWLTFSRQQFQMHFLKLKSMSYD